MVATERDLHAAELADSSARRELSRLKWLSAIVPGAAVLLYQLARYEFLEHVLPDAPAIVGNLLVAVLVLLMTYAFASFVFAVVERVQRQTVNRVRELAAMTAVLDERQRLSRDLHDGLAQLIAFVLVRIDTVEALVQDGRHEDAINELERTRGLAGDLYTDVREAIAGLRSRVEERGLVPALRDYVDEFEERHDIRIALEIEDFPSSISPVVSAQIFWIVQEALANVGKHSQAEQARVRLRERGRTILEVEIADDGVGFDVPRRAPPGSHPVGLQSMRERAEMLGGELHIDAAPAAGTRVRVTIPYNATAVSPSALARLLDRLRMSIRLR